MNIAAAEPLRPAAASTVEEPRMLRHRANTINEAIGAAHGVELDLRSSHLGRENEITVAHEASAPGYRLYEYLCSVLRSLDVTGRKNFVFAFNIKEAGLMPALDRALHRVRQYYDLAAWSLERPEGYTFFTFDIPGAELPEYARLAPFGRLSEYESQCRVRSSLAGVLVDPFKYSNQDELLDQAARARLPIALISRTLREGPTVADSWLASEHHAPRFLITKLAPLVRTQD